MAGGMGGFFGFYPTTPHPYPHPEQLKCAREFWRGRVLLTFERANELTDGYCLRTPDNKSFVFYREDTAALRIDLSKAPGPLQAIAVDTKGDYAEIDLGLVPPRSQTVSLPRKSDWAVAVGAVAEDRRGP